MNLADLRTAVDRRTGIAVETAAGSQFVNESIRVISGEWDWPWLETTEDIATVIGTATIAPAANWLRTIDLRIANGVVLRRAPIDKIDFLSSAGTGEPRLFSSSAAGIITLFPTPSTVVTLKHRYVRAETELALDADTPEMPASYHPSIVEYAAHLVLRRAREEGRAEAALKSYVAWLEQMRRRGSRYADTRGGGAEYMPPTLAAGKQPPPPR